MLDAYGFCQRQWPKGGKSRQKLLHYQRYYIVQQKLEQQSSRKGSSQRRSSSRKRNSPRFSGAFSTALQLLRHYWWVSKANPLAKLSLSLSLSNETYRFHQIRWNETQIETTKFEPGISCNFDHFLCAFHALFSALWSCETSVQIGRASCRERVFLVV